MHWKERIATNKNVLGGRPAVQAEPGCSVSFILELMAAGSSEAAILANYPQAVQLRTYALACSLRAKAWSPGKTPRSTSG